MKQLFANFDVYTLKGKSMETHYLAVKDLNVASFLMASNQVKLVAVHRTSDNTAYFHFEPIDVAQSLVSAYWADSAPSLQPRKLFGARRDLQDLVFSGGSVK